MNIWDMHCHIVPGVDDGAENMDVAMALIEKEYEDGVRGIIFTPHFRRKMFHPADEQVAEAFQALKEKVAKYHPDMELYLGCELHIHTDMMELLAAESVWPKTMGASAFVLLEFAEGDPLSSIVQNTKRLLSAGYRPILAHIERYVNLAGKDDVLQDLQSRGAYLQINADSIIGKDGFGVKRRCKKWLKKGLISYVGSDGHNMDERVPSLGAAYAKVCKILGEEEARRIFVRNPERIIDSMDTASDFE